jgi:hypothetical protein
MFTFKRWAELFSADTQNAIITYKKIYEKWNESTISPKGILEYLLNYDLETDFYNKIYNLCSVLYDAHFYHGEYKCNPCEDKVVIITSYYPNFEYTIFKKIEYETDLNVVKDALKIKINYGKVEVGDIMYFDDEISFEYTNNTKTINKIYKCCENIGSVVGKASHCMFDKIHYVLHFDNNSVEEKLKSIWKVKKYSHKVNLLEKIEEV